ncbi:MAG: hypothetical protein ACLTWE_16055 [Dysgonomonas mossii]|uniref:hypothetical protein n=1 Tax=Dysgonomonas mossii TaxID=163665 RepID=UPI00399564DF
MKQIKFITVLLLFATMVFNITACSSDEEGKKEDNLIIGKWELINKNYNHVHTHLEIKSNGTFEYTSDREPEYKEVGIWKIESEKLYQLFSDEDEWMMSKIHEVNSINLILEEYDTDKGVPDGLINTYQRVK